MKFLTLATVALLGVSTASAFAASPADSQQASVTVNQPYPMSSDAQYNAGGITNTAQQ
jgi:hypothetical protein